MGNQTAAFLWWEDEVEWEDFEQPFTKPWKNDNYAYLTELAEEEDFTVICGEYRWYEDGIMKKAWYWTGEKWEKKKDVEIGLIYDLFRHDSAKHELKKEMQREVKVVNDPDISDLCQDKYATYREFSDLMVETRKATKDNVCEMMEEHGEVVLKPRYGSGGHGIEKLESLSEFEPVETPENVLVQEFIETDGMPGFDVSGPHDLRMTFIDGEIAMSYIRTPDDGFRSNMDQGGDVKYLELDNIPVRPLEIAKTIAEDLKEFSPYIVSVDFMYNEKGEPVLVELNSQPGVWVVRPATSKKYELPAAEKLVEMLSEAF